MTSNVVFCCRSKTFAILFLHIEKKDTDNFKEWYRTIDATVIILKYLCITFYAGTIESFVDCLHYGHRTLY